MTHGHDNIAAGLPCPNGGASIELDEFRLGFAGPGRRQLLQVLDGISANVKRSEFVALVGPSGCGKTSLLRCIGGLIGGESDRHAPSEGRIAVDGLLPQAAKRKGLFGFAFQNPVLLPWRTLESNVHLPFDLRGSDSMADVHSLLCLVGLDGFRQAYPHELSGGMQQRANIARAIVHQPRVLLLDEPFASLDEITRERLNLELRHLHSSRAPTVLLVTHSLREAAFLADRILVLSQRPARVVSVIASALLGPRTIPFESTPGFLETLRSLQDAFRASSGTTTV